LKDNFYLLLGTGVINVTGFLFHFFMGRKLGPEGYGTLATLMALVALLGIFSTTIQFSISKFVASFKAKNNVGELRFLYHAATKKINKYFVFLFLFSFVLNFFLSRFLSIPYWLLMLTSLIVLTIPSLAISRGFLQGLQRFKGYGENLGIEGLTKLLFGVFLVYLGWHVYGAIFAVLLSYLAALLYGGFKIRDYAHGETKIFETKEIYKYTLPMFFTVLFFTAFYSIDLILVKHFFNAVDAGNYAVVSLIGKVVFFASFSVVQVMFPKAVELSENKGAHKDLMWKSFGVITLITLPILAVYYFFGEFVVSILFGNTYLNVVGLIAPYGMFMAAVSFSKLLSLYMLSLKKFNFLYLFLLFFLLEIGGIWVYHGSLEEVIHVLNWLGLAFMVFMLLVVSGVKQK